MVLVPANFPGVANLGADGDQGMVSGSAGDEEDLRAPLSTRGRVYLGCSEAGPPLDPALR